MHDGRPLADVRLGPRVMNVYAVEQHDSKRHHDQESGKSEHSSEHGLVGQQRMCPGRSVSLYSCIAVEL